MFSATVFLPINSSTLHASYPDRCLLPPTLKPRVCNYCSTFPLTHSQQRARCEITGFSSDVSIFLCREMMIQTRNCDDLNTCREGEFVVRGPLNALLPIEILQSKGRKGAFGYRDMAACPPACLLIAIHHWLPACLADKAARCN
jgi:hypothetical protein